MIVAFNPELKRNRVIIQRSYAHSLEQLTRLNHLTQEQIYFLNNTLIKMLKDIAFNVAKRKCKKVSDKCFV